jgi:flagellin
MSLRINTNTAAINTHRNLVNNTKVQDRNLERLSSGLKINRGADAPAQLQISEQFRAQAAGLRQAIDNTEMGVSLMQTAESALDEVSRALINARQIAVHAANEATNDPFMLQSDQQEIDSILQSVNRVAKSTQYGKNFLLDGSKAGNGVIIGDNLEFLEGGAASKTSGTNGYGINVTTLSQRNEYAGTVALTQQIIDQEEQLTITEGGRTVNFRTQAGDSVEQTLNRLNDAINDAGLNLDLLRPDPETTPNDAPQVIRLRHKEYGSEHTFTVASNTAGVLSAQADVSDLITNGVDIAGEINGEAATGRGQVLTGMAGAETVEGIKLRYTGDKVGRVGTLTFAQNSLSFQIGGNAGQTTRMSMKSMQIANLGKGITNDSDFGSLAEIKVLDAAKAQDSILVLDRAIEEVASARGDMGAFQKNNLESNLNYLRIAHENVMSSESVVRDADMAAEMTAFTRNQIMTESSMAMLAQSNQRQQSVLRLLG